MLRRAGVPVPISNAELRALAEPKAFSPTETLAWSDPVYADDVVPVTPPTSAALIAPFLIAGYGVMCGAAFLLRLAKRGLRGLRREADKADRKVTVAGLIVLVALMLAARYAIYAVAAMGGGW